MREGLPAENGIETYGCKRKATMKVLSSIVGHFNTQQWTHAMSLPSDEPGATMPKDFSRDDFTNASISYRAMVETEEVFGECKKFLGCTLSESEEEMVLITLDYVLKRVISSQMTREVKAPDSHLLQQPYLNSLYTGLKKVLPGNLEIFTQHDIIHILLAVEQGLANENSVIPAYMQDTVDFSTSQQSMLEEAYAVLFTKFPSVGGTYDDVIKQPRILKDKVFGMFDEKNSPLLEGMTQGEHSYFQTPKIVVEAVISLKSFMRRCRVMLLSEMSYTDLVLYSQAAGFGASFESKRFTSLDDAGKLAFIKEHIAFAEQNIDILLHGGVPEDKDEKFKKTVAITRSRYTEALQKVKEDKDAPIFAPLMLEILSPLYDKAKAQADTTFERLSKKIPASGVHTEGK